MRVLLVSYSLKCNQMHYICLSTWINALINGEALRIL